MKCQGRVNVVGDKEVRVSLFTNEGEVVGDLARSHFPPRAKLEPGRCFNYEAVKKGGKDEVTITLPRLRKISDRELARMRREVEKMIPKGEF